MHRGCRYLSSLLLTFLSVVAPAAGVSGNGLAVLPPMGWNSWNKFGCNVSENLIRETADAMVSSGMMAAGYEYINIDDCWQGSRAADGTIGADPERFPNGIKELADYVHGKGLKLGVYTDAGNMTCQKRPGSYGYEAQDINTYAGWGVDYVKIDWCYAVGLDPQVQYAKFGDAIAQASHPMVFSICNWGANAPWRWAAAVGANLWRTTTDIHDTYDRMSLIGFSQNGLAAFAGPGHWNDPDMLEVGNGGMTLNQYQTHMALWAILAAPLLAGNDLRTMTAETTELLTNPEVIAVDQDPAGQPGQRVWEEGWLETWVRPLADGSYAVGLFNRTGQQIKVSFDLKQIGLANPSKIRDLWKHEDVNVANGSYTALVPGFGVAFVRVCK